MSDLLLPLRFSCSFMILVISSLNPPLSSSKFAAAAATAAARAPSNCLSFRDSYALPPRVFLRFSERIFTPRCYWSCFVATLVWLPFLFRKNEPFRKHSRGLPPSKESSSLDSLIMSKSNDMLSLSSRIDFVSWLCFLFCGYVD